MEWEGRKREGKGTRESKGGKGEVKWAVWGGGESHYGKGL